MEMKWLPVQVSPVDLQRSRTGSSLQPSGEALPTVTSRGQQLFAVFDRVGLELRGLLEMLETEDTQ